MLGFDALGVQALGGSGAGESFTGDLGLPVETDTALSVRALRVHAVGLATETDEAFSLTFAQGQVVVVGLAVETDSSLAIAPPILGLPEETDTALPVIPLQVPYWPFDFLKPRHIGIYPRSNPIGGGISLKGIEPTTASGAGYWCLEYGGVYVPTRAHVHKYRQYEALFEGRGRAVLVYLFDGKRAPWPGAPGGSLLASADSAVAEGATSIDIDGTGLGTLFPGMHFSAGHYAYQIKSISAIVGDVYTCTIWPETREAIASGAPLEFGRPILRVRLKDDRGMSLLLKLLKYGDGNVEFVEDVP